MTATFLINGSVAYDYIFDYPGRFREQLLAEKLHVLSVSFTTDRVERSFGGTAGNIAYNLRLLGVRPILAASVGANSAPYERWMRKNGVRLLLRRVPRTDTASAYVFTDQDDNQISAFVSGALKHPTPFPRLRNVRPTFAVVSPGNPDDLVRWPRALHRKRIPFLYDPGQMIFSVQASGLRQATLRSTIFVSNDYELAALLRRTGLTIAKILRHRIILVTTYGPKGSRIHFGKRSFRIPAARPRAVVDPTGAGDAYRAGFLAGFVRGWPLPTCGRLASVVSVYTVEQQGTQTHRLSWPDVRRRYRREFKEDLPH